MRAKKLPYVKQKRVDVFAIYNYNQFPYERGLSVMLNWNQGREDICSSLNIGAFKGSDPSEMAMIQIHPLKFPEMVQEKFGAIAAIDMCKVLMREYIDRLADEHFKHIRNHEKFI